MDDYLSVQLYRFPLIGKVLFLIRIELQGGKMTSEEKKKAIDALRMSAPVMAMTQEEFNDYIKTLNKIMDLLEQEPEQLRANGIDELISKREALASIKALYSNMMPVIDYFGARRKWLEKNKPYLECENAIMTLQPVKPETVTEFADRCRECGKMRTGHWIIMGDRYIKCSECKHITKTESPDIYHFCMVCGTKMSENPTYPESEGKNGWV